MWFDYKCSVKKKLRENHAQLTGTGGGPYRLKILSDNEEKVAALTNLKITVDGNRTRDWGIPQSSLSSAIINTEENPSSMATTSQTQSQTRPQKSISSASSTPHQSTSQNIEPAKEDEIAITVTSIKKTGFCL